MRLRYEGERVVGFGDVVSGGFEAVPGGADEVVESQR